MPTVQLEYKVIETGPKVSQVVGDAEKSLARLKDAGGGAGKGLDFMTVSSERASLSFRTLNRGVNDMAAALGASHPEIANIALGLGHVAERIASVGLSAGLMGGLVIAAGAGVAALMKWTERTDEAIEFQVRLNHSVQEFDTSGMIAQLKKVGEELEILQEKAKAGMRGTNLPVITSTGVEALYGDIEGGPVTAGQALAEKQIKDLQERQKKISEELERIAPLSFEKQLIEITSKIHAAQSAPIPSGGPTSAWAEQTTAYLKQDEAAAKRLLDLQKQVAMGQAASEEERARVSILSAFQRVAVEETTTAKITAVQTALAEHQKALADQEIALKKETAQKWLALTDQQLGKAQAEYQKYSEQVKALETQMAASKAGTADVLAGIKQAGMTPAEAFADREKRAQQALAEAMKRSGQEQVDALTAVQKEYAALATEAQRAHFAQTQTQAATDQGDPYAAQRRAQYWWLPENQQAKSLGDPQALADQVKTLGDQISKAQEGMRDTAKKAADASKGMADQLQVAADNLKKSLDTADALGFSLNKAAEAARALAAATAAASAAGGSKPSGASDQPASSSGEYVWTGAIPPAGSVGGDYGRPSGSWGEPGDYGGWDNYDVGGTVPGPIGRPRRAIVHGGETVIPAGGGGGQPVMFVIQLAGRDVGSVLLPDLQEAISAGRLRFSGGLPGGRH